MIINISAPRKQKDILIASSSQNSPLVVDKGAGLKIHNDLDVGASSSAPATIQLLQGPASPLTDSSIPFDNISIQPDHVTLKGARTFIFKHYSKDELTNRMLWKKPDFTDLHLDILIKQYQEWVRQPIYLVFRDIETNDLIYRRGVKRGNDIYKYRLNRAMDEKTSFMNNPGFAARFLLHGSRNQEETRTLFMTLTWNPDIFLGSRLKAWLSVPYFFNKFMARFRKKYGKTWVLKSIESTKQGFPHIHLILITEKPFKAFRHDDKVRIRSKHTIDKMWHSFTDVQVPKDLHELKRYLFKDVLKQYNNINKTGLDYKSLTLNWIFQRQSYSISGWDEKLDLIMESVIQTIEQEFEQKHRHRDLEYLGLVHLQFPRIDKPPSEFTQRLSDEQFRELEGCMFKRPDNPGKAIHVLKECSCGLNVILPDWNFQFKMCRLCAKPLTPEGKKEIRDAELKEYFKKSESLDHTPELSSGQRRGFKS